MRRMLDSADIKKALPPMDVKVNAELVFNNSNTTTYYLPSEIKQFFSNENSVVQITIMVSGFKLGYYLLNIYDKYGQKSIVISSAPFASNPGAPEISFTHVSVYNGSQMTIGVNKTITENIQASIYFSKLS